MKPEGRALTQSERSLQVAQAQNDTGRRYASVGSGDERGQAHRSTSFAAEDSGAEAVKKHSLQTLCAGDCCLHYLNCQSTVFGARRRLRVGAR